MITFRPCNSRARRPANLRSRPALAPCPQWPHAAQQLLEEATLALGSRTMQVRGNTGM